jgi:type II secretory ATPase GspE/PulE/Tfp pilus assembly ATPase PilB-like protein/CheY-like chemotaxis protein
MMHSSTLSLTPLIGQAMYDNTTDVSPLHRFIQTVQTIFPGVANDIAVTADTTLSQYWEACLIATGTDADSLAMAVSQRLGYGVATSKALQNASPRAIQLVPEYLSRVTCTMPLSLEGGDLVLACANPHDQEGLQRVRLIANRPLKLMLASPERIAQATGSAYAKAGESQSAAMLAPNSTLTDLSTTDISENTVDDIGGNAVVKLARGLLAISIKARASDLHIQPHAGGGMCRIRVDGVLRRIAFLPDATLVSVIRFFKVNAGMDSSNRLIAQDGQMSIRSSNQAFDLRLSVVPASRGERLVIRFLEQGRSHSLAMAGFSNANLQLLRRLMSHPNGVVLLTGPTGSGKTSTLYAFINEINRTGINILTVENPVEYRVAGVSQVEVNTKVGLTFASALRSFLRQDPDVVLIGEIRDQETAEIAMQASLTGRLVLSTLRTSSALGAIPRLIDLGVSKQMIADAVRGIVGQRLFRQLCAACRVPTNGDLTIEEQAFADVCGERPPYRPIGCKACDQQGYTGRFPVIEVLEILPELADSIRQGALNGSNTDPASIPGFAPIAHTAALRVVSGDTTVAEAVRVLGPWFWSGAASAFGRPIPQHLLASTGVGRDMGQASDILVFSLSTPCANEWAMAIKDENHRPVVETQIERIRETIRVNEALNLLVVDLDLADSEHRKLSLLRQLREETAWARLPAVVVLAEDDTAMAELLAEHGYTDVLFKPVDPVTVARTARLALER